MCQPRTVAEALSRPPSLCNDSCQTYAHARQKHVPATGRTYAGSTSTRRRDSTHCAHTVPSSRVCPAASTVQGRFLR